MCNDDTNTYNFGNAATTAEVGASCIEDYVYIEGAGGSKNSIVGPNRFCGTNLNFDGTATLNIPIIGKHKLHIRMFFEDTPKFNAQIIVDCTGPFQIGVHSDGTSVDDGPGKSFFIKFLKTFFHEFVLGFCLHYRQLPC